MIYYHPDCDLRFSDFGIEIPIVDDRAAKVYDQLKIIDSSLSYTDLNLIPSITADDLRLVHTQDYVEQLCSDYHHLEQAMLTCYELVDKEGHFHRYNPSRSKKSFNDGFAIILKQVGLTYLSTKESLKSGFSYFLGGGMHHAMSFTGRGFCLVNDIVITLRKLQNEKLIKTAWVIDVDAHKGDGTAELTARDKSIVTLSIHMHEGWPLNSGSVRDPWFIPSNIDIGISSGEEDQYLLRLEKGLLELEANYPKPDVVIVVNGADPYEYDKLESTSLLNLPAEQLLSRDKMLYQFLKDRHIPQSYLMAGGYGDKSWEIYYQFLKFVREDSSKGSEISSR